MRVINPCYLSNQSVVEAVDASLAQGRSYQSHWFNYMNYDQRKVFYVTGTGDPFREHDALHEFCTICEERRKAMQS